MHDVEKPIVITNYDFSDGDDKPFHHVLLPNDIRMIICGRSGCGKTVLMLNLVMQYLNWNRFHIYSRTLNQEKYEYLQDWATELNREVNEDVVSFHSNADDILPPENFDKRERTIMIFDDVLKEKQDPIEDYFMRGRHNGVDSFYLCQNYCHIPKQLIRDNANMLVLFDQDARNLQNIHYTFVGGDMDFKEFQIFFTRCVSKPFGFCVIDKTSEPYAGKYRDGLNRFYIPMNQLKLK